MSIRQATYRALDWFVPNAATIERSEIGLARNFIATHLFGPFLFQSLVLLVYCADPSPGLACYAMMVCVAAFWFLPFGLRLTGNLQLMALISVELLSVTSLVGTSYYGGVNSPFLPWLLVSLMLGLFYLSDHVWRVITLFAFNIVGVIGVNLLCRFPQHLSLRELSPISWFSVFSATAYMSIMAIYYAGIITMQSTLERETERHRLLAQRLRKARQLADLASHGKSVFLDKMRRQFEEPLINVAVSCERLTKRLGSDPETSKWTAEIQRIDAAGQRLLRLVHEAVDINRAGGVEPMEAMGALALDPFIQRFGSEARSAIAPLGHTLFVEQPSEVGTVSFDSGRLRQALENLLVKAAAAATPGNVRFLARRHAERGGDWIEFQIRTPGLRHAALASVGTSFGKTHPAMAAWESDPELEISQMQFAVMGGNFDIEQDNQGGLVYTVEIPAPSSTDLDHAA